MKRAWPSLLAIAVAAGCAEQTPPGSVQGPAVQLSTSVVGRYDGDYVPTPAGWYHRSCVHEIPDGARVGAGRLVTLRDGTTYQLPKCLYPAYHAVDAPRRPGAPPANPVNNGWIEWTDASLSSGNTFRWLSAYWTVPATPEGSYSGGQVYYTFPGLRSSSYILQPVLSYSTSGWQMASWRCDNDGDDCDHSEIKTVATGDHMYGKVVASDCANGVCSWWIHTMDLTRETQTILNWENADNYSRATGGALEVYGLTSCSQYAGNGVFYSSIYLLDKYDNVVSPTWGDSIKANTNPSCNWSVTSTSSATNLFYNAQLDLSVSIVEDSSHFYTATPTGGYPPYSYYWEWCGIDCDGEGNRELAPPARRSSGPNTIIHGWQFLSTEQTVYWTETQRWLRSTVTDSHSQQAVATYYVE